MRHEHHAVALRLGDADAAQAAFEAARERLLRYQIFPPSILRPLVDGPDGVVDEDVVVVFHASMPLLPASVEAAVRVTSVWDGTDAAGPEAGIEIATLAGHPERGHERFAVALDRDARQLSFTIETRSRPGSILVRLAGPLGRWIQARAARAALREFHARVEARR